MHPLLYKFKRFYRKEKLPDPLAYLYKWFGATPEGVLQIGANNGQEIKRFTNSGIEFGVFVEPLPNEFRQLESKISQHPGYLAINALCASESDLEKAFFVSNQTGQSSSMLKPTGHLNIHPDVTFTEELALQTTTVDEIIRNLMRGGHNDLLHKLDMMFIDVQGAELDVLKGSHEFLKRAKFVFVEVSHGGLYEGDASIRMIMEFLEQHQYKLAFSYFNKHGWGDALFIKDEFLGLR